MGRNIEINSAWIDRLHKNAYGFFVQISEFFLCGLMFCTNFNGSFLCKIPNRRIFSVVVFLRKEHPKCFLRGAKGEHLWYDGKEDRNGCEGHHGEAAGKL